MNHLLKQQLFGTLGIESADVDVSEEDLPENVEGESAVAEEIETVEESAEIEETEDQLEDLDDSTESLDELDVAVESFRNANKSLSPLESIALNLTVKQVTSRFIKDTGNLVPAVESFRQDAEHNTKLAHENIKETAVAFKDGIVQAIKKVIEFFKGIVQGIIDRFRGVEGRANKIIVKAKTIKETISGDIELKKDNYSVDGDADPENVRGAFTRLSESVAKIKKAKQLDVYDEIMKELNEGTDLIKFEQIIAGQNKFMEASFKEIYGETTESEGNLTSKGFPGEFRAVLIRGKEKFAVSVEAFERKLPEKSSGKMSLAPVQANDMIALATTVKVLQKDLAEYKGFIKRLAAALVRFNSIHVQNTKRIDRSYDKDKTTTKEMQKQITPCFRKQITFFAKLVSNSNTICGNMLTWCEKSIALAGKGVEAKGNDEGKKEEPKSEEKTA